MKKDFDKWNERKKQLHNVGERPHYHEREVWWCSIGVNLGNELDGTGKQHDRPIIVIRPFNTETFFGISLVGRNRKGKYYFPVGKIDDRDASANLSQVRIYDTKRLVKKIGTIDSNILNDLCTHLKTILFVENNLPPQRRGRGRSHM